MSRYNRERDRDSERDRAREEERRWAREDNWGRSRGRNPNQEFGPDYGRQYRTSDRMYGEADWGRAWGRESDARRGEDYDRYGMENQDWRHMDDYWRSTYGNQYPRESDQNRWVAPNYSGRGPKNYKRTDDRVMEDVNERLTRHPGIDATEIDVAVTDGEVTLRGVVDRREAKRMAEDIAENVYGVKDVRNELKIRQQVPQRGGDRAA